MKHRSHAKEWMDLGPDFYTPQEYAACLDRLFTLNRWLGFFRNTVQWLKRMPADASLVDVGCGGGLFVLNLSRYYPNLRLQGIDVSALAIDLANQTLARWRQQGKAQGVEFVVQPELNLNLVPNSVDVVLITLVCHHLSDAELVPFLQNAYAAARTAVVINDLHRHRVAYWFYYCVSPWLFRNRLITHDGLISIQRGFTRREWQVLLNRAGISLHRIRWQFPFRWRVVLWKS